VSTFAEILRLGKQLAAPCAGCLEFIELILGPFAVYPIGIGRKRHTGEYNEDTQQQAQKTFLSFPDHYSPPLMMSAAPPRVRTSQNN